MASRRKRIVLIIVGVALAVVVGGWLLVGALFDGYRIPVESMEPTVHVGDRVLARSIDGEDASRGDIVIFTAPDGSSRSEIERISRVIAVEGDEVRTDEGSLLIDGEQVNEPYLRDGTLTTGLDRTTVPAGHVFVLSDNRANAQDSRVFGPVPLENIYALVTVRWWPLSGFGGL
jgi:signal peptidase I